MQKSKRPGFLALSVAAASSLGLAHVPWGDLALKESDHKRLAKDVAAYWSAREEKKGIQESFEDLVDTIEKTQKKLKDQPLLSAVEDWEEVFRLATAEALDDKVRKGKVVTEELDALIGETEVTYRAPKRYTSRRGGPVRLILAVPEPGTDPEAYLEESWADETMREEAVIVAVPIDPGIEDWNGKQGVYAVMTVFSAVKDNFAVDYDRIFVGGTGKGFSAAVATASAYPQLFAGVIGMGDFPVANPDNLRSVPSLLISEADGAKAFGDRAGELQLENCTVSPGATGADVWAWMEGLQRDPYPARISFYPRFEFGVAAHWLSVDGVNFEEGPHVEATVDRASNTITIDAEHLTSVTISFNDALVDMESPIKVLVNGAEQQKHVTRNQRTMIDLAFTQGDWGRVFTNVASFDVTAKSTTKEGSQSQESK